MAPPRHRSSTDDIFNEPQRTYIGYEDRLQRIIRVGQTVTFGINGRFVYVRGDLRF